MKKIKADAKNVYKRRVKRKKSVAATRAKYMKLVKLGYSNSDIARKLRVSRGAVSKYLIDHNIERNKKPKTIGEISERILWHIECAESLRKLAEFLVYKVELASLDKARKNLAKFIKEIE